MLTTSPRIDLIGNALLISSVATDDAGDYTCRATNPAGTDQATGRLVVFGESQKYYVTVDSSFSLELELEEVVIVTVENVEDPVPASLCNNFDSQGFQVSSTQSIQCTP